MTVKTWSLFSGAGGLDLGFAQIGLPAQVVSEIEPVYCRTLRLNLPEAKVIETDVSKLNARELAAAAGSNEVDLLIGGPPCQSFCPGGTRAGLTDPRGNLILEYMRIIKEASPSVFVLENVANLITAALRHRPIALRPGKKWNLGSYKVGDRGSGDAMPLEEDELSGSAIRYLLSLLSETLGYSVSLNVLNSADYGAAQTRLRFVLIGTRDQKAPPIIAPTHGPLAHQSYVTVLDAIGDLADNPGVGSLYTPEVARTFDMVPPGGNWRSLPPEIAESAMGEKSFAAGGGKTGFYRRLAWDRPSPTITGRANRKGSALCHPSRTRPLSVRECARIQGFPDTWEFSGSMADQYTQIGNAVPVALGRAVGETLRGFFSGTSSLDVRTTDEMLHDAEIVLKAAARNTRSRVK